ncbi:RagB/SusD family nutrient uptake outer membrane protein [Bacteroides fragilis]|uniref:RagB/SusD family nutrient uptake outer membrane protein n=1 Tax=Bacteroides fragilis TaxID=817 RepID=UPI002811D2B0|nr:RagB/SusD family nutrient uptake outer membrane protein [Bacteroides fragilis]WMI94601.1 RagB/SusD family nutrient uptake outer membrane protein [Bacteroides fragilis]
MKFKNILLGMAAILLSSGCSDFLDLEPKNKITGDQLFSSPEGVKVYMANLYSQLPIEDFVFDPEKGFNYNYWDEPGKGNAQNYGLIPSDFTDEAASSEYWGFINGWDTYRWWDEAYKLNRDVLILESTIPTLNVSESMRKELVGECAFVRGCTYLALARRYGGVPLIKELQQYSGDVEVLKVPRSTEKETWDYVLGLFDTAVDNLPDNGDTRRASKWVALGYKSRAALHAASLCKFWTKAALTGDAVSKGYVGMDAGNADMYYRACITASQALMNSGHYSLFKPTPANPEEAAKNYQEIFEYPNNTTGTEAIFIKGYARGDRHDGHSINFWNNPNQTSDGAAFPGRTNPALDLVDVYERYDHPGQSAPIVTTADGDINDLSGFKPERNYLRFDAPMDIFKGKDARLFASVNLPGCTWRGVNIVIQNGIVKPDGSAIIDTDASYTMPDGKTYYTFGASNSSNFSGFMMGTGSMTRSGFLMKKFLNEKEPARVGFFLSNTDFIEIRYAEILLNYAEAVAESGYAEGGAQAKAAQALNAIRKRAGYTADIALTPENVQRERQVELAFENKRHWDLVRRREFHGSFNNRIKLALVPMIDLRGDHPQYIFVRKPITNEGPKTFSEKFYYGFIPGVETTGITQNPQY